MDIDGNVKEVLFLFPVQVGMQEAVKIFEAFFLKIKTPSSHHSANCVRFASFLIAIRYRKPDSLELAKAAIVFISEDKKHCYEQVEKFEKRALEICEKKCGQRFKNWTRWSDSQCCCSGPWRG